MCGVVDSRFIWRRKATVGRAFYVKIAVKRVGFVGVWGDSLFEGRRKAAVRRAFGGKLVVKRVGVGRRFGRFAF